MSSAVVVGATSGVGRSLAVCLAEAGHDLLLVARDADDLDATARDIRLRFTRKCEYVVQDIAASDFDVERLASMAEERLGAIEYLLVPAGGVIDEDFGAVPSAIVPVAQTNYVGPARLAAAFGNRMRERKRGSIVLFTSIATSAPRTRNAAYSAAKAALEVYAKALRYQLEPSGVRVLVMRLGYVDTAQSFGMKLGLPVASPLAVARFVLRRLGRTAGLRHFPAFWRLVTLVLRHLPWSIYRRLSF